MTVLPGYGGHVRAVETIVWKKEIALSLAQATTIVQKSRAKTGEAETLKAPNLKMIALFVNNI